MRGGPYGIVILASGCNAVFGLTPTKVAELDARPDGFICSRSSPFDPGTPVPISGMYSVEAARFNRERSIAYLSLCPASGDKAGCDLYSSGFNVETASFTAFSKLNGVSYANAYDAYPSITPDGQHIVFGSDRPAVGNAVHIWVADAVNSSFDSPRLTQLDLVANADYGNEPYVLGDGRTLYFSAGRYGGIDTWDLYRANGDPPMFGGTAELLAGTDAGLEFAPVVADDELEMFFARGPSTGTFTLDIYTATRTDPGSPFGPATRLDTLSTPGLDWPVWISPDACELYYIAKTAAGVATLYVARR
jgi:hypothetical protein